MIQGYTCIEDFEGYDELVCFLGDRIRFPSKLIGFAQNENVGTQTTHAVLRYANAPAQHVHRDIPPNKDPQRCWQVVIYGYAANDNTATTAIRNQDGSYTSAIRNTGEWLCMRCDVPHFGRRVKGQGEYAIYILEVETF